MQKTSKSKTKNLNMRTAIKIQAAESNKLNWKKIKKISKGHFLKRRLFQRQRLKETFSVMKKKQKISNQKQSCRDLHQLKHKKKLKFKVKLKTNKFSRLSRLFYVNVKFKFSRNSKSSKSKKFANGSRFWTRLKRARISKFCSKSLKSTKESFRTTWNNKSTCLQSIEIEHLPYCSGLGLVRVVSGENWMWIWWLMHYKKRKKKTYKLQRKKLSNHRCWYSRQKRINKLRTKCTDKSS